MTFTLLTHRDSPKGLPVIGYIVPHSPSFPGASSHFSLFLAGASHLWYIRSRRSSPLRECC